jgi:hypothetical protein
MRHRRRCNGPIKSTSRRKACDACFQAKVKCCYTQPACTRCTKRGTSCVYATSSEQPSPAANAPPSSHNLSSSEMDFVGSNQQFDLPARDCSRDLYCLDNFDMTMAEILNAPLDTRNNFDLDTMPALMLDDDMPSTNTSSSAIPIPTPISLYSNSSASSVASPASFVIPQSLMLVLSDYPSILMKGSFSTPILHLSMYALYSNIVPDMTFLPQTSMAICCGSGLSNPDTNRFFRRAMNAAQQRLIGSFVSTRIHAVKLQILINKANISLYATMGRFTRHDSLRKFRPSRKSPRH